MLNDERDRWVVGLAFAHAGLLALAPSTLTIGVLMWWNANALSHQHTHRRFFRRRSLDALFSAALTLLLGLPQRLWQQRHLAHHAERRWRLRVDAMFAAEGVLAAAAWVTIAALAPAFFAAVYLPGLALGLGLCALHGHYEHAGGATSCYSRVWNLLFLNDGYHAEHHAEPGAHVFDLPGQRRAGTRQSRWPPVLRWLGDVPGLVARGLDVLERGVLRAPALQALVLDAHRRALTALVAGVPKPRRVMVVGGGLFPRSALLACELWPTAEVTVLDADPEHLARARSLLPPHVRLVVGHYTPGDRLAADVVFLPLALRGDRARAYAAPAADLCIVHDWLWRRCGAGRVVAWWLGKRVNLVRATPAPPAAASGGVRCATLLASVG